MKIKTQVTGFLSPLLRKLRLKKVIRFIDKNKTILDAGCDDAYLLKFINSFKHYTGTDLNSKVIKQNKKRFKKFKNIDFFQSDLNKPIKFNKKYDIVILSAVVEHLRDFNKFLTNLNKGIKKDTLMIITTPTKKSSRILDIGSKFRIFSKEALGEHQKYFSYKDFINIKNWKLKYYKKFEFGLNQIVVMKNGV